MIELAVVVVVIVVVVLVRRGKGSNVTGPEGITPTTGPPGRAQVSSSVPMVTEDELARTLGTWVEAGLLAPDQADAILAHEAARRPPPPTGPMLAPPSAAPPVRARASRVPLAAEALGYLGGILATVGLVLLVARYWPDLAVGVRLTMVGVAAAALFGAGALVHEAADPAFARLRGFLWLASGAAAGLFGGLVAADVLDATEPATIAAAVAATVAAHAGILWAGHVRPLQQAAALVAVVVFAGALVGRLTDPGVAGLAVGFVAAGVLAVGLTRLTTLPLVSTVIGAVGLVVAGVMTSAEWQGPGLVLAVAIAGGLVALAVAPLGDRLVGPAERIALAIVGGVALVQTVPGTLGYFSEEAGVVTGLITWSVGAGLVGLGARRLVRAPVVIEVLGGLALLGGAALTATQAPDVAPLFGLVTAVGLLALGMIPGQVLLSLFGSLGLLVNVPWAIGRFFPGEGRAPLLILVSGALILGVALVLARMGDRFRHELVARPPRDTPPGGDAGGPVTAVERISEGTGIDGDADMPAGV